MEYISTSALANELEIKSKDLFDKFKELGWIERQNDKWVLTDLGKKKGGQTRTNPKYGEFVVWPENISLDGGQQKEKPKLLNATAIGKYFDVSSQRLNLILSEFGWIEKDLAGWTITKLGKNAGGRQFEHETSGGSYVLWPENLLQNKSLVTVFSNKPIEAETHKLFLGIAPPPNNRPRRQFQLPIISGISLKLSTEPETDILCVQELK